MKDRLKEYSPYQRILLISSLAIYMLSFVLPAFTMLDYDGKKSIAGFEAFLTGGLVILGGGLLEWIIWVANPLFMLSIFLRLRGDRRAIVPGIASVLLALSFLFWKDILAAENGRTAVIASRNAGYFLWLISFVAWIFSFKGNGE
ncbi:hypothetical protein A4H97_28300 [Niastella yeongjuensis]|uniref:Uncharacterized protein n=1 Tax=Niastella yeongjuensis TaxID=354355 RepID=A0A1V9EUF1_9BACT|nr:hypothetical protein [Niastella yeongjuensis]OQP49793.1 hypothetical protein A4H97_28300 [Niastella yeongjuensis]SEP40268.1 hypothetical protein SAMN05660816_05772 [Niastella yeongjuensis]